LGAGNYTLTIQDNNGCSHDTTFVLSSISGPTAAQITTIGEACSQGNGSVSIGAITNGTSPYQYSFNAETFGTTLNFNSLQAGTYPIIIKDAAGCTFSTNAIVAPISAPSAVQTTIINEVCGQQNGGFTIGTVTGGTAPFQFNFNNLGFSSFTNYSNLAIGIYTLIVKDVNGCTFTTSVQIGGTPLGPQSVNLSIQAPQCGSLDGSLTIASVIGGTSPYLYSIDNSGTFTNTTVSSIVTGSYQLTVSDANNCLITTNFAIPVSNDSLDIHIPNVFSPNGDAANPTWFITGNCIQTLECVIVNRWGDVMRTFTSNTDEWDGTFNGKNVVAGVYFYKSTIQFSTGKTEVYHGHITVVY
jgi:gliding motility-associated-like protein